MQFAFDKLDDEAIEFHDIAHVSIGDDFVFQELAILDAEVDDARDSKHNTCNCKIGPRHRSGKAVSSD